MRDQFLGRVTPTHAIMPSTKARWVFFSLQKAKNPHEINRDASAFRDVEELPHSTWNGFNEGCWQMTWGWSMSHHSWRKQRENSLCFMGQVLELLTSEIPAQCWCDHLKKSLNWSSNAASSVTEGK